MRRNLIALASVSMLSILVLPLSISSNASGMCNLCFGLSTSNPVYSNPYGKQYIMGVAKDAYISVTASKSGYANKQASRSWISFGGSSGSHAEVEVYGPTFTAEGTSFRGYGKGTHPSIGYQSYSRTISY